MFGKLIQYCTVSAVLACVQVLFFGSGGLAQEVFRAVASEASLPARFANGQFLGAANQPLSGVRFQVVVVERCGNVLKRHYKNEVGSTDAQGKFVVTLPEAENLESAHIIAYREGFAFATKDVSRLRVGGELNAIVLRRKSKSTITVLSDSGAPVAGAKLRSFSSQSDQPPIVVGDWGRFGLSIPESDEKGQLQIPVQFPGDTFCFELEHADFSVYKRRDQSTGQDLVAKLDSGREIPVHVVCTSDGRAVNHARVQAVVNTALGAYRQDIAIDAEGRGTFRVASQEFALHADHPDYAARSWYSQQPGAAKLTLQPYSQIHGRVVLENGEPVEGVEIGAHGASKLIAVCASDAAGRFSLRVPSSSKPYAVSVYDRDTWINIGQDAFLVNVSSEADGIRRPVEFVVVRRPPFRGIVTFPDGKPASNAVVQLQGEYVIADEGGEFVLRAATEKPFFVRHPFKRYSGAFLQSYGWRDSLAGKHQKLELGRETTAFGRVVDEAGVGVSRAPVIIQSIMEAQDGLVENYMVPSSGMTRDDGTFRIDGIPKSLPYSPVTSGFLGFRSANTKNRRLIREIRPISRQKSMIMANAVARQMRASAPEPVPEQLGNIECNAWLANGPIRRGDLEGRSVLLAVGSATSVLPVLQLCHRLYADHGLSVVYVVSEYGLGSASADQSNSEVAIKSLPFAVGQDSGAIRQRYSVDHGLRLILYDSQHKLVREIKTDCFREVRSFMLSQLQDETQQR